MKLNPNNIFHHIGVAIIFGIIINGAICFGLSLKYDIEKKEMNERFEKSCKEMQLHSEMVYQRVMADTTLYCSRYFELLSHHPHQTSQPPKNNNAYQHNILYPTGE